MVYWPMLLERAFGNERFVQRAVTFTIRTNRTATAHLLRPLQEAIWTVNPGVPVTQVRTLQDLYDRSMARTFFTLVMLGMAGAMALLLGIIGIYGVVSYTVGRRTREIGIRMALGARAQELTRMFVRDGLVLAGVGMVFGLFAAVALTQLIVSLLFGVTPLDPWTYLIVAGVLLLAATLASYIPAHRVTTTLDPVEALRIE
jgi:putative ABC transport system permease protein